MINETKEGLLKLNSVNQGDCLEVMKGIPDKSIDSIIVDPPYGIDFQSARRTDKTQWKPKIINDKTPFTAWTDEAFRILKDDSGLLCFTRWDTEQQFRDALTKSGFKCKQQIIWDKVVHGMGDLKGDFAKLMLANSITLTPGTLSVDIKDQNLYVHTVDVKGKTAEENREIISGLFERILGVIFK